METLRQRRERLLGTGMQLFYDDDPVHIVKGEGVWLYDKNGRKYLDCYNNVPHVGHCHPHVVEAITQQVATLNTHTRYLHETIVEYAEQLTATFSDELATLVMVCTGSEANDIALRMAQAMSGKTGIIATDNTYHGNTAAVSQLSTRIPPIGDRGEHVRLVPAPDSYRPLGGQSGPAFTTAFTKEVENAIASLEESGHGCSGMILCPFFANEGFPDVPDDFLHQAVAAVHKAGGVIIADEVQPGFGRVGSHMWGHERAGIQPDIVTLGKPMANGHPVAAVVTSAEIMQTFRQVFRYFNTFGGNPVSCAAALATLEVLQREQLMKNAHSVGAYAKQQLQTLAEKHELIGDVRGAGLFFGAEMVIDKTNKTPAPEITTQIVDAMRHRGILLGKLGIHQCTLKIRPPMPFSKENADYLIANLDDVLTELT